MGDGRRRGNKSAQGKGIAVPCEPTLSVTLLPQSSHHNETRHLLRCLLAVCISSVYCLCSLLNTCSSQGGVPRHGCFQTEGESAVTLDICQTRELLAQSKSLKHSSCRVFVKLTWVADMIESKCHRN